ncbi:MAG TPA: hypothetical protein VGM17_04760 [Rhizomicrobium sp.]|jgi:hypothetical protein
MIAPQQPKAKKERRTGPASASFDLPYRVELWDERREKIERIVARAHSETLARAIFTSACEQYPGRHLSLWRGRERLAEKG